MIPISYFLGWESGPARRSIRGRYVRNDRVAPIERAQARRNREIGIMSPILLLIAAAASLFAACGDQAPIKAPTRVPPAPLYRDPVFNGAADPSLIWNDQERAWWVFYTNRRANAPDAQDGVRWCHGTDIGIASSTDGGLTWTYRGIAKGLEFEPGRNTV